MSPKVSEQPRGRARGRHFPQLTGHLGWIGVILVLALTGAGINLYAYLRSTPPQVSEPSALGEPAAEDASPRANPVNRPQRPDSPADDSAARALPHSPAAAASAAGEKPENSQPLEALGDQAPNGQTELSQGRQGALAELTKTAAPRRKDQATPSLPLGGEVQTPPLETSLEPEPPLRPDLSKAKEDPPAMPSQTRPLSPITAQADPPLQPERDPHSSPELPAVAALLKRGDYRQAATQGLKALQGTQAKFTISLEVACQPETLQRALEHSDFHPALYLLPRKVDGQSCFALLWGLYAGADQARRSLERLPDYFKKQTPPPRVAALKTYLK